MALMKANVRDCAPSLEGTHEPAAICGSTTSLGSRAIATMPGDIALPSAKSATSMDVDMQMHDERSTFMSLILCVCSCTRCFRAGFLR